MFSNNINIVNIDKKFSYYFEYFDNKLYQKNFLTYNSKNNSVGFYNELHNNLQYNTNYWEEIENFNNTDYIPEFVNISTINVYFPVYSLDVYQKGIKYALNTKIWIDETEVSLGCYLLNRLDSVACDKPKKFLNQQYYEKIELTIPDPYYIIFSDEWKKWRIYNIYKPNELFTLSGPELEDFINNYQESNDVTSNILLQFHPVEYIDNKYLKLNTYQGGQNTIYFNSDTNQYLNLKLQHNFNKSNTNPCLTAQLNFNKIYNNDLQQYLLETYNMNDFNMTIELVVKDDNNIYKYLTKSGKSRQVEFNINELEFTNWNQYLPGMKFYAIATIQNTESDEFILEFRSNEIFITKELFKFLIIKPLNITNINLNTIDMINYKCNIVNKIQKNIVKIDKPSDYKNNIIKPVFFRTQELSDLQLHGAVTENISINLDSYKNKVDIFYLNVNGTLFQEIGRNNSGVIFKIVGNKINKSVKSGNYYILNQDQEMVTFGNYTLL